MEDCISFASNLHNWFTCLSSIVFKVRERYQLDVLLLRFKDEEETDGTYTIDPALSGGC